MRKHLTRLVIAAAVLLAAIVVVPAYRNVLRDRPLSNVSPTGTTAAEGTDKETSGAAGLIYGRIHTVNGEIYEGRLRWGGDQEASWDDFFNGTKSENPWSAYADRKSSPFEIFGVEIGGRDRRFDRLFM